MKNQTAIIVSDGSVKNKTGTSCFVITTEQEEFQVIGLNRIPGYSQDSHRAELGGVIGALTWLNQFLIDQKLTDINITLGLDGESAVKSIQKPFLPETASDYDILWLIQQALKSLREKSTTITIRWIKGHQTKFKSITELDIWGRLNELADSLAKNIGHTWKRNNTTTTSV